MKLSELVEGWPEKAEGVCMCDCLQCKTNDCSFCELTEASKGKLKNGELCYEICCCAETHNKTRTACDKEVMVDESMIRIIIYSNTYVEKCILKIGSADDVEKLAKAIAQNIKGILKEVKK